MNQELPDVQLDLEKAQQPEFKLPISTGSSKKAREFQKNIYFCFNDYAKALDCTLPASWEICMQVKKQQLELDMELKTDSK